MDTYTIKFGNGKGTGVWRNCHIEEYYTALSVFDSLCKSYLVVQMCDSKGTVIRSYNNTSGMGNGITS